MCGLLLSGPEPQRTYLEQEVLPLLRRIDGPHLVVRGLATGNGELRQQGNCLIADYGDAELLRRLLRRSSLLIARSGYSSLMDFVALGISNSLLIPTPGQTEQIYLAERARQQGWARVGRQGKLSLELITRNLR